MAIIVRAKDEDASILATANTPDDALLFEHSWYFSPELVDMTYLQVTERTYTCPYKGVCYWIDLVTPELEERNIAFVYEDPSPGYEFIAGRIAFYDRETMGTIIEKTESAVQ